MNPISSPQNLVNKSENQESIIFAFLAIQNNNQYKPEIQLSKSMEARDFIVVINNQDGSSSIMDLP